MEDQMSKSFKYILQLILRKVKWNRAVNYLKGICQICPTFLSLTALSWPRYFKAKKEPKTQTATACRNLRHHCHGLTFWPPVQEYHLLVFAKFIKFAHALFR